MAPSRHVWHTTICASTLLGLAVSGARAEEADGPPPYRYQEVRVGIVGAPAPTVRQDGANWGGGESRGYRYGITYLRGCAPFNDYTGTVWGAQFSIGTYNVQTADNIDGEVLNQGIVDVYYGFQYGIVQTDALRGFAEILPYVGVGVSDMDLVKGGEYKASLGAAYEMGIRTGVYLTEHQWLAGLTAAYVYGASQINADQTVNLHTNGFQFGGELGYRF